VSRSWRRLIDLYCGVGLFSVLLSDSYQQVYGIEEGYEAVQHAKKNAERNHISNVTFEEGKVEQLLSVGATRQIARGEATHVIVDPPRVGLKPEVIDSLKGVGASKLVYVSCSLESLKHDLKLLEDTYEIKSVQPLDLFPQTRHVETIILMEPRL